MTALAHHVRTWSEMIKLAHSVFALPFAVLGLFLAARSQGRLPRLSEAALIVVCMVAARCAAMTFNRIVDARWDARNPRTAGRAIPAGTISVAAAWGFFVGSCGLFVLGCTGFFALLDNPWPLRLCLPVLLGLCLYSYTKRFTAWSHVVLGTAIAFSPVAAWIAISPHTLGATAWLLMAAVTFWVAGFDLIYACQDVDFDRAAGLHSVPAWAGVAAALWTARAFHVLTVLGLLAVGLVAGLGFLYWLGVSCVALLLLVENALVRPADLRRVNLAFFTLNGVVGVVLGALGVMDIILS
jgi:4-hydroxybenzoate polyprenyltransferase